MKALFGFAAVAVIALASAPALATKPPRECPRGFHDRTPEEVLADHQARLADGDIQGDVDCNYDADAVVIADGGVARGSDQIFAALSGFGAVFGGQVPIVNDEIVVSILNGNTYMVRLLFSITTPCVSIADGADTYIIKHGQIQAQTSHGFPTFTCGPPPGP
ncbi:MAG TPA: hypothetical protein VGO62_12425 [Myxococcota bacterium]|jgi:hypothetical protein